MAEFSLTGLHVPPASPQASLVVKSGVSVALLSVSTLLAACKSDPGDGAAARLSAIAGPIDTLQRVPIPGSGPQEPALRHRETLQLRRELGDSLAFGYVTAVQPFDDFLVVGDQFATPHLIIIDRATGKIAHRIGRTGKGPGEFTVPWLVLKTSSSPPLAKVVDTGNRRITHIAFRGPAFEPEIVEEIRFEALESLRDIVPLKDGRVLLQGLYVDYTFVVTDRAGKRLKRLYADPPFREQDMPLPHGRMMLNDGRLVGQPDGPRFALAYLSTNRIDFFAGPSGPYFSVSGPHDTETRYHAEGDRFFWDEGDERAYVDIAASNDYVYALFCGCTHRALRDGQFPTRIHVFTWNGRFVGELVLDKGITALAVSDNDESIWGAFQDPVPLIGEWQIPEWLRQE